MKFFLTQKSFFSLNLGSIWNECICFNYLFIISFVNEECNQFCPTIGASSCACLARIIPVFHAVGMENVIAMSVNQVTDSRLVDHTGLNTDWAIHAHKRPFLAMFFSIFFKTYILRNLVFIWVLKILSFNSNSNCSSTPPDISF